MLWVRKTQESMDEQVITVGCIISDLFLSKIQAVFNSEYFINDSLKTICKWCLQYYTDFEKAPQSHIQDIFEEKRFIIDKAEASLIEETLKYLQSRYTTFEEPINEDYFIKRAKDYFTKRDLKVRMAKVQNYLELDKLSDAEAEMLGYKEFSVQSSPAVSPFDSEIIQKIMNTEDRSLFKFPGALGELVGPIERGYLIGILGLFKRGKSFLLMATATLAASCKLKVAIFSLEMQDSKIAERILRNIGTFTKERDAIFPCFDCKKNQIGICNRPERVNEEVLTSNGHKPEFNSSMSYRPCTYCRVHKQSGYEVATWFEELKYPDISSSGARKAAKSFEMMYGNNIRLITYPRFTANIKDIERDLFLLEEKEMFIPDVMVIDYAGILKPEDTREERRIQIDTTWKRLAQLASERNCVVVTASQGTRSAIYKKNTDQTDIAEWIGILGHVDIMLTLNQTTEEKKEKILRIGTLVSRNESYIETKNALLLTNFGAGQVWLDSFLINVGHND